MINTSSLRNHFLIAVNSDSRSSFHHAVVYVCEHNENGSMGLVINRLSDLELTDIFSSLEIKLDNAQTLSTPVFAGGPVKENVGFVLHRDHGNWESSVFTSADLAVTSSKDIMHALANQQGPKKALITLGFSGWHAGQLEEEIAKDYWLISPVDETIIFDMPISKRWHAAIENLGFSHNQLSRFSGHA